MNFAGLIIARLERSVSFANSVVSEAPRLREFFQVWDTVPSIRDRRGAIDPGRLHALRFLIGRQPPLRRQTIDNLRQVVAKRVKQLLLRHAGLRQQRVDLVGAESLTKFLRRDGLVRTSADP